VRRVMTLQSIVRRMRSSWNIWQASSAADGQDDDWRSRLCNLTAAPVQKTNPKQASTKSAGGASSALTA
jgi:hypothetical protein